MSNYMTKLAKAAIVFAAVAGGSSFAQAQEGEEELTRDGVVDRIQRVESAIAEHKAKGEDEHVEGATAILEQLQAALRDFDSQNGGGQGGPPGGQGGEEEDVFSILDQDQDGRISREEFQQGFEEEPEGLWDQEDKDQDGFISYDEFGGPKGQRGGAPGGGAPGGGDEAAAPTEVFYMMDTDGDNRISKEEFDAHFENIGVEPNNALFNRDDVDKNGFIEFEEFGGNKAGGGNLFVQLDVNSDNRLSREEFSVEWHTAPIELFENDDKDGDGFVSFDEFGGPKGQGGRRSRPPPRAAGGEGGEGGEGAPQNMFALLDEDQDGRISLDEFNADWHNAPEGLWEQEDQNGDGFIAYEEFSGPKGQGQGGAGGPPEGGEGGEEDVFSVLDQDQDGRISREEFVAGFDGPENEPEGLWAQEDANDDGFVSYDEFGGPKGPRPRQEL